MRQKRPRRKRKPKPWEAIGMSRATWYRHGKPTEKPRRITVADEARRAGLSVRTHQRIMRVMTADIDLAALMLEHGWCKPGQAERIVADPVEHRRFRKWLVAEKRRKS
jgi:hypothetical protein